MIRAALVGAALLLGVIGPAPAAAEPATDGPLARTRTILERSNAIVRGSGDRKQKLLALGDLLRDFLDTEALARLAAGKHLEGRSPEETAEFLRLFRELFIRTYVQRLLLFDAPEFSFGEERVTGDNATVATEIVTPRDRFAVDYSFRRTPNGWRATDIRVEQVSLAQNFRAQFDSALAKDTFQGLLERLRKKVGGAEEAG
jgi:phospholipid transport system substrate-binding protein